MHLEAAEGGRIKSPCEESIQRIHSLPNYGIYIFIIKKFGRETHLNMHLRRPPKAAGARSAPLTSKIKNTFSCALCAQQVGIANLPNYGIYIFIIKKFGRECIICIDSLHGRRRRLLRCIF